MRVASVQPPPARSPLEGVELRIAVDVTNPLLGAEGATAIYGPQKGVRDWQQPAFDAALATFAAAIERDLGASLAARPGAGAGGGLPVGLLAAAHAAGANAAIESGAALVADLVALRAAIAGADLVLTGEGSLDAQTAYGKTVAYVAERATEADRPCLAVAGLVSGRPAGVLDTEPSTPEGLSVEEAMSLGAEPLRAAAERLVARWVAGRGAWRPPSPVSGGC